MTNFSIPPIRAIDLRAIEQVAAPAAPAQGAGAGPAANHPFGEVFQHAVNEVERFQQQAAQSADRFLSGEGEEIHKVALDAQRAELSFDLFLQARNKVVDAYQEIMRMQL